MNKISCPHCGKQVEISEALKHQVKEAVIASERAKHKEELEKLRSEVEKKTERRIKEDLNLKFKDTANELEEAKIGKKKLYEQLLEMSKTIREVKEQSEKKEIENEKKLNQQVDKIREDVSKTLSEKARLKELELIKKLHDTQKALEEAQRKSKQGSQQLQGEVLELDLEEKLKTSFIFDEFMPIPKGIEGADVWQKVKNKHNQEAGSILWETKRTKAWAKSWLSKLREDTRKVNANVSVLISEVLPDDVKYFARIEGVWVTSYEYAVTLAGILRDTLLQIAIAKSSASHEDETLQEIYDYIISEAFRHKIEAHFEGVKFLKEDLDSEKRAMERIWKKREIQINRLDRSMSQMFGEIQGIAGSALPTIKELGMLKAGEKTEQEENF
ncbi:MAG: DUF2130 domain-containing protein [Candidatus Levyibacteriota bacterium]